MNNRKGDDIMAVLAVPCDNVIILTKEKGEEILASTKRKNLTIDERAEISRKANEFRKKQKPKE